MFWGAVDLYLGLEPELMIEARGLSSWMDRLLIVGRTRMKHGKFQPRGQVGLEHLTRPHQGTHACLLVDVLLATYACFTNCLLKMEMHFI